MENSFTAVYQKIGDWYVGYTEELPGANTQGKTLNEVRGNLKEAVELILLANRELAEKELSKKDVIKEEIKVAIT